MRRRSMCGSRRETGRRAVLPVSCTLALWALCAALGASAPSLSGTTLCLSPTTVMVSGVPGPDPSRLAARLFAEARALFRAQGVRFTEAPVCTGSPADFTLRLDVRPLVGEGALETRVSARVDDRSRDGAGGWLSGSVLRWSAVEFGEAGASEAGVTARLLEESRTLLARVVRDWKAAHR